MADIFEVRGCTPKETIQRAMDFKKSPVFKEKFKAIWNLLDGLTFEEARWVLNCVDSYIESNGVLMTKGIDGEKDGNYCNTEG